MYSYNYKNLPYKQSVKKFIKDHFIFYYLIGRFTYWKTKGGKKIRVKDIEKHHLCHIVHKFGNTYIRTNHPYIWYRYLKDFESKRLGEE